MDRASREAFLEAVISFLSTCHPPTPKVVPDAVAKRELETRIITKSIRRVR